ncbi:MAG: aldehyde dehydrogenase EutE [Clostridiales bacterium]|nr:aldehyde dehydrogenase EutE [Clostridiales bacterium]
MQVSQEQLEQIVKKVMAALEDSPKTAGLSEKRLGVFPSMDDALVHAAAVQERMQGLSLAKREEIISNIRQLTLDHAEEMAMLGVSETKMGRVEDKILKHRLAAQKTPGTETLRTEAVSGDYGLTLTEHAPYGVIGAITPSTNPSETVICNSIGMIAAGSAAVFSVHPQAAQTSLFALDLVNRAAQAAGLSHPAAFSPERPSIEASRALMSSPIVKMLVCTGGPGVVKAALSSGKKAIGAGAGNPPVIVDDSADIKKAAGDIIAGCSFDNNLPCIAEKEVFALDGIYDELIAQMRLCGAFLIGESDKKLLERMVMVKDKNGSLALNRDWVGRDAWKFMEALGLDADKRIKCLICEADFKELFVQEELMMPILPIVRASGIKEAIDLAVKAEHGLRHSAHMHSKNVDHLTEFARAAQTTIFVKNAPSYAGIGVGAEGYCTFTIAGPTGEGLTCAPSFTRSRRCVMSDSFRIV